MEQTQSRRLGVDVKKQTRRPRARRAHPHLRWALVAPPTYFFRLYILSCFTYIIFGTNLLTGGPAQIAVFCLFECFAEKEYQTESKRKETFARIFLGTNAIQETWSGCQGSSEEAMRQEGAPPPSWAPCNSTNLLLSPIYTLIP